MKYFSLADIAKEFNLENLSNIVELRDEIVKKKDVSSEEFYAFLTIQSTETRIFNSWIEQNKGLKNLFIHQTTEEKFNDVYKWREHTLFNKFKGYVGPFFLELLQKKQVSNITEEWATIFSYFELMDDENRFFLEQNLYEQIQIKIDESIKLCTGLESENHFHQQLQLLLSDACISIHNSLSRASHSLKINFIEQVLQLFYHPLCSAKLAHWMILQLEKLNLNEEQKTSLQIIKDKIKQGQLAFKYIPKKDPRLLLKNTSLLVFVCLIIAALLFLFNRNFEVPTQNFNEASALSAFSVKERKEIDSLLRRVKAEETDTTNITEEYFGTSIQLRQPFKNVLAEKIYRDFERDLSNHYNGDYDSSVAISKNKLSVETIASTASLKTIPGNNELTWKNDSEYTLILLLWKEDSKAPVYSGIVAPKSSIKFNALKNMHLLILPGIGYGKIPFKNSKDFQLLKSHFCSIDFNFEFATQQVYTLSQFTSKTNKILIEGTLGEVVTVSDPQGILNIDL